MSPLLALCGIFLACAAAAGLGAAVTLPQVHGWYAQLDKPAWTPPDEVFGPVWTVLYIAMAVAAWLVWRVRPQAPDAKRLRRMALSAFWIQLAANAVWSPLFFGLHAVALALVDILLLLVAIVGTAVLFQNLSRPAALVMLPYLGWVSYAAALNAAIWALSSS